VGKLREREFVRRGGRSVSAESAFPWQRPPAEGFTADDLDQIPDLPSHTELIDGSLILVSPQKRFHMRVLRLLENALARYAPRERFLVSREMSVVLSPKQRPEPDLIVIHADAEIDDDATWYPAEAVVLAVEVVSPESEIRDRKRKPQLYAEAGIPYFWRVENIEGKPVVYAYELDPTLGAYTPLTIFHDRVQLPVPFPIDIDLTEIERM
jgi:Uma2 family endonuclease